MSTLVATLRAVAAELESSGERFAVVGGLAVSARAAPRLTRDADIAVAVDDDAHAEALVQRLQTRGFTLIAAVEQQATGRLATARLVRGSADGLVTDLLFASSGIEPEVAAGAERLSILPGLVLPVASVGHLVVMKLLARDDRQRPLDADDLEALRAIATETDWKVAGEAAALVMERGAARGRDLPQLLTVLRVQGAY